MSRTSPGSSLSVRSRRISRIRGRSRRTNRTRPHSCPSTKLRRCNLWSLHSLNCLHCAGGLGIRRRSRGTDQISDRNTLASLRIHIFGPRHSRMVPAYLICTFRGKHSEWRRAPQLPDHCNIVEGLGKSTTDQLRPAILKAMRCTRDRCNHPFVSNHRRQFFDTYFLACVQHQSDFPNVARSVASGHRLHPSHLYATMSRQKVCPPANVFLGRIESNKLMLDA